MLLRSFGYLSLVPVCGTCNMKKDAVSARFEDGCRRWVVSAVSPNESNQQLLDSLKLSHLYQSFGPSW